MQLISIRRALLACAVTFGVVACGHAAPAASVAPAAPSAPSAYTLLDAKGCTMPKARPPKAVDETYEQYRFQRRFLDIDGSGQCVMMDFWIARLGGSASPGMRTLDHRFLRVVNGKWQAFETELAYFPHVLKAADGKVYLVEAPVKEDTDDAMVLAFQVPRVFSPAGWTEESARMGGTLALDSAEDKRAQVLPALAALLEQHYNPAADPHGAVRARILLLRREANQAPP